MSLPSCTICAAFSTLCSATGFGIGSSEVLFNENKHSFYPIENDPLISVIIELNSSNFNIGASKSIFWRLGSVSSLGSSFILLVSSNFFLFN